MRFRRKSNERQIESNQAWPAVIGFNEGGGKRMRSRHLSSSFDDNQATASDQDIRPETDIASERQQAKSGQTGTRLRRCRKWVAPRCVCWCKRTLCVIRSMHAEHRDDLSRSDGKGWRSCVVGRTTGQWSRIVVVMFDNRYRHSERHTCEWVGPLVDT